MIELVRIKWRSKRQQVLVAWLAAWPTLTLVLFALQPLSQTWSLPMRSLASATAMVFLMNFVSVPIVSSILAMLIHSMKGTGKFK
jgi:antibiotic biosynthesis monooxygenase (ABM) superfamily enzyme